MGYKRRREKGSLPCSASLNAAHGRKGALWPIPVDVSSYQWLQQSPHGTLVTHGCMTGSIRLPSRRLMTYTTIFEPFARIYFFLPSPRIRRRVSSLLSPPKSWSSCLQIFLLGILYLSMPTNAGGLYSIGTDSMTGSTSAPSNLGKTEGCFSKFDFLLSQTYPAVEIDNRVCQAFCASQRFSVSATSLNTCYCGNNYPSAFFKVKDDICDNPCSPDKTYCFVYACCGSRDGTYFTVAFAGQLLRQLTYDYRMSNPRLRDHIKTLMGASAPLQVMSSNGLSTGVVMSGGAGIGLQGSCPDHYSEFKGACYSRVYGKMMSYIQAKERCQEDGASLAVITSREENDYLTRMLFQRPGWIGLSNRDVGGFQWDDYTNWGPGEPNSLNGFVTKLPVSGAATGDAFDDLQAGVRNIRQLAVYSSSRLLGVQGRYLYTNGSEIIGNVMGTNKGGDTAVISLSYGQYFASAFGDVVNDKLQSLNLVVKDVKGNSITYGPYGTPGGSGAKSWIVNATGLLVGFFGFNSPQGINQLGFYDLQSPRCEEFTMLAVDQDVEPRWGTPLDVYLQHSATGAYLGIDGAGNVFTSTSRSNDAQLQVVGAVNTTGFTIKSKNYGFYLKLDPDEGHLKTLDSSVIDADDFSYYRREHQRRVPVAATENRRERNDAGAEDLRADESFMQSDSLSPKNSEDDSNEEGIFARKRRARNRRHQALDRSRREVLTFNAGTATPVPTPAGMKFDSNEANKPSVFSSTKSFGPVSVQNLQIGVTVQKSESMPNPRYCSLKIYDLTATSDSFSCYYIQGDTSNLPMVDLSVQAFTIQDKTTNMKPRTPLQNGRTKCENESPTDTLTCTFSYGEGLTFSTALSVTWGQNYANQFQMERRYGENTAIWYNYLYAYDNQYTSITTNTYVESRNWAVNVPVPPLTVCTIQYWLTSVDVNYVWLAILKATGSFELSANGVYFGTNHALSDVSDPWDLNVYQWGRYSAASQAEVIITTDEMQAAKYQLQVPPMNNIP
ncbi:low affinity immunoglobulin epsilon fc receptor [Nannochloropsis gaditana]|uniref:Low affinity immunoglobulin epsilon fc receptor n=1 Tax=Nannochloropsis gaditana TaxID=72520 RepID=W7U285_9STRA|nr:low affinity immunoglobulin epsilon fc receptor [Nannochloropsis gaditana]